MSFDQEWAQLKAAAAQKQQVGTRLNQLPPEPGGGSPQGDLQVSNTDLAALGDEAFKLHQRLDKDGDHARRSSEEAAASLKADFSLGGALADVTAKWEKQANSLLESCAHISNHLDYTQKAHAGDEHYIATSFSVEQLDAGFSEGTERR